MLPFLLTFSLGLTSGCGLIGEKEPAGISAQLGGSSTGCLDQLGPHLKGFWAGTLTPEDLNGTTQCVRTAFGTLSEQVEGTEKSASLSAQEFKVFANTLLFPKSPLSEPTLRSLLKLKAYIIGGDPERWAKSDSQTLIRWVATFEELGPEWLAAIKTFRQSATQESWESLGTLTERTEARFLALLPEPSESGGKLDREDVETLFQEITSRTQGSEPPFFSRLTGKILNETPIQAKLADVLFFAARFIRGLPSDAQQLDGRVRSLFLQAGFRLLPSVLGFSFDNAELERSKLFHPKPSLQSTSSEPTDTLQLRSRQRHTAYFIRAAFESSTALISLEGSPLEWDELFTFLEGHLSSEHLRQARDWAPLIKVLLLGGDETRISREEVRNGISISGNLLFAAIRPSVDRWKPQLIISALIQGWERIRDAGQAGTPASLTRLPAPFPDRKIIEAIQKLETLDPDYQLPPSLSQSLPQALRLARSALEGPHLGTEISWDRWLGLLRLASTLDGPVFEIGVQTERRITLITRLIDRVVETTKCTQDCIPTEEVHSFFREEVKGTPFESLADFKGAKELVLGGNPDSITLQNLRDLKTTLLRLTPTLKALTASSEPKSFAVLASHIEPVLDTLQKVHPRGVPTELVLRLSQSLETRLGLTSRGATESELELPPLAQLLIETLSGARLTHREVISPASWQLTGRRLRELFEALGPIASRADFEAYIGQIWENPEAWAPLRTWIQTLPNSHPRGVLSWRIVDAWIAHGVSRGWIDVNASASELSGLARPVIQSMHRNGSLRAIGIQSVALQRFLETAAYIAGPARRLLNTARAHSARAAESPLEAWSQVEEEVTHFQQALSRMRDLYPRGIGIPLSQAAAIIDRLPAAWFTLDRTLIKNGLEPTFNRIWICSNEEAFCPSGLISLLNQLRIHVRAEKLAALFGQQFPSLQESGPREEWLRAASQFHQSLSFDSDRRIWMQWKTAAEIYPQLFQGDTEQALFVPTSLIFTSNTRVHFHFERFSDFFMRAYDSARASTPLSAAPIRLPEFIAMADDFDDLAKAFKALESRTPSMAATRFREAGLFSSHGNGDDELTVREFTGYFVLIWSSKTLVKKISDQLTPECPLPTERLDLLGRPYIDMPCFRRGLTQTYRESLLRNLPGLLRDWRTWSEAKVRSYVDAMERTGRERGFGNDPIPINDMDGIASLLQYMESLMLRFDTDQNDLLDQTEVHAMFPFVRSVIAAAVRRQGSDSIAEDDAMLESLFTWVLTRKRLPQGPIPFGFLAWHSARESRRFTIGRYDAMIAISVLLTTPAD